MNGKTSKLVRLYVGLRARQGRPVNLKDVKRRYRKTASPFRFFVKDAMCSYLDKYAPKDVRELRASRPRKGVQYGPAKGGILRAIAAFIGLTG